MIESIRIGNKIKKGLTVSKKDQIRYLDFQYVVLNQFKNMLYTSDKVNDLNS